MITNNLKHPAWVSLILALLVACASCGKAGSEAQTKAFDKAPPEIKAQWDTAVEADKTNDYYTASATYAKILSLESKLTPKQLEALETASRDLSQRMVAAANNGDDIAKQALAKLMQYQKLH